MKVFLQRADEAGERVYLTAAGEWATERDLAMDFKTFDHANATGLGLPGSDAEVLLVVESVCEEIAEPLVRRRRFAWDGLTSTAATA